MQLLEKPFSTPFSGGPVITYRKEENTRSLPHHPSFSPKLQDDSPALGLITEQLRPSQKRPTLKICVIYNHLIHELPECHTPPLSPTSLPTSACPLRLPNACVLYVVAAEFLICTY